MKLDGYDRRILAALQADATQGVADIAERVGLSTTPCWRRIQKLEAAGFIRKRVALLDRQKLNAGIIVFIAVRTNQHNAEWFTRFHKGVSDMPEVLDFYRLSGDIDYLIRVAVPTIQAYDEFYQRLIRTVDIYDVSSMIAMEELKSTTELPLDYLAQ